jgi:predicted Rdx family selenoprotein
VESEIKTDYPSSNIRLVEGGGGVMDVIVDGHTVYSKRKEECGNFPAPFLINKRISQHLQSVKN